MEFPQAFAWDLHDCLQANGAITQISTSDARSGLRDRAYITSLAGHAWGSIDVTLRADSEERYTMMISRQDSS